MSKDSYNLLYPTLNTACSASHRWSLPLHEILASLQWQYQTTLCFCTKNSLLVMPICSEPCQRFWFDDIVRTVTLPNFSYTFLKLSQVEMKVWSLKYLDGQNTINTGHLILRDAILNNKPQIASDCTTGSLIVVCVYILIFTRTNLIMRWVDKTPMNLNSPEVKI